MIDKHFKLFRLDSNATLNEIKIAYRKLAKQNHPDYFTDSKQKKKQEIIMQRINEAYNIILEKIKKTKNKMRSKQSVNKPDEENDYILYKKGIYYYNIYFHSFFQLFFKRDVITTKEKEVILIKAKSFFERILREYPNSDWLYDSKEKLKIIEKTINVLNRK